MIWSLLAFGHFSAFVFGGMEMAPLLPKSPFSLGSGNFYTTLLPYGLGDFSANPAAAAGDGRGSIRYSQFFPNSIGLMEPLSGTLLSGVLSAELPLSPYFSGGALWEYQGFGDAAKNNFGQSAGTFSSFENLFQFAFAFSTSPGPGSGRAAAPLFPFPVRLGLGVSALASGFSLDTTSPAALSTFYALLGSVGLDVKLFRVLSAGFAFRNFDFRFNPASTLNMPFDFQIGVNVEPPLPVIRLITGLHFAYVEDGAGRLGLTASVFHEFLNTEDINRVGLTPFLPARLGFSLQYHTDVAFLYPLNFGGAFFVDFGGRFQNLRLSYGIEYKTLSGFDQSLGLAYYFR
ncbi:MAG: hypothetical protein JNM63_07305 [Spirochaetia bacterium]|nr:hypothetical protein [Spirochaetia bacterium]